MHYRVEQFRGFVQVECLSPYFGDRGCNVACGIYHSFQQIQQRLLLFLVYYLLNILGPQTLVRY